MRCVVFQGRRESSLPYVRWTGHSLVDTTRGNAASHVGSVDESDNRTVDSLAREYPQSSESSRPLSVGRFLELLRAALVCADQRSPLLYVPSSCLCDMARGDVHPERGLTETSSDFHR